MDNISEVGIPIFALKIFNEIYHDSSTNSGQLC